MTGWVEGIRCFGGLESEHDVLVTSIEPIFFSTLNIYIICILYTFIFSMIDIYIYIDGLVVTGCYT